MDQAPLEETSQNIKQLAIDTLLARNKKHFEFNTDGIDIEDIISRDIKGLHEGLLAGKFSSVQLVHVFGSRTQSVGRALCLSTEENFDEAIQVAAQRDQERLEAQQKGLKLSPIHGIPISVKDFIDQKGFLSTVGCAYLCDDKYRATKDAAVIELYKQAGAIPMVRGNVAQAALSFNATNMVFGQTRNPLNQKFKCGGSSGGDAGMVAARCVVSGLGTDIGGSIRHPAACCGIYGLKPTSKRVSMYGMTPPTKLRFNLPPMLTQVIGPLSSSVDDLIINSEILFSASVNNVDPFQAPCPLRQQQLEFIQNPDSFKNIKIGMLDLSDFPQPCSKSVQRALQIAGDALTKLGFTVVPIKFDQKRFEDCFKYVIQLLVQDAMRFDQDMCQEGELLSNMKFWRSKFIKDKDELEQFLKQQFEFVHQFAKEWRDKGITALIMPVIPHCAKKIDGRGHEGSSFMHIWNITGFPNGVMPITRVTKEEEVFEGDDEVMKEQCQETEGMPISILIAGYSFQDEDVLGIMKLLEKEINFKQDISSIIDIDCSNELFDQKTGYTQYYK